MEQVTLLIVYSSGDLGDVGRHCVAIALGHPLVRAVRVLTSEPPHLLYDTTRGYRKCSCPPHAHDLLSVEDRLQVFPLDLAQDELPPHVVEADVVISCLGSRQPFHPESSKYIAKRGTERVIECMLNVENRRRLILLSSVGIGNDWPPLNGLREGNLLTGFFRTICWNQFQDLSGAERAAHRTWSTKQLDYVTARCGMLPDEQKAQGTYRAVVQDRGEESLGSPRAGIDYKVSIAKVDAALFLVKEAVEPTLHRQVVVLGGEPSILPTNAGLEESSVTGTKKATTAIAQRAQHKGLPAQPRPSNRKRNRDHG